MNTHPVPTPGDAITGLPSQEAFIEGLNQRLVIHAREKELAAVVLIDLDGFRTIKDTHGYLVANELLRQAAVKIAAGIRKTDDLYHLGGDDFAVLTTGFADVEELYGLIRRILGFFNREWAALEQEFFMTAGVGVALLPEVETTALELWRSAASALIRAKEQGKNQFLFYQPGWHEELLQRHRLEVELRHAVENGELELYYQPQVELQGRIVGFEALLRWRHPSQGLLAPADFLDLAEQTGLWLPMGEWVLGEACRQALIWQEAGLKQVPIAVNVSANQLQHSTFLPLVQRTLEQTGLEPSGIEIEITEGAVIKAIQCSIDLLQRLRQTGVKVALDDFGTGYSSLSYLRDLPVDVLKIDRSFVQEIGRSRKSDGVLGAVLVLAQGLGLDIVGEGVETTDQLDFLASRNCQRFQGYLFSKPLPAAEAAILLAEGTIPVIRDPYTNYNI